MRRLRDLSINKLSCPPSATVGEATALMERNGQSAVAVVETKALLGIVTYEAALLVDSDIAVREVMRGIHASCGLDDSIRAAARAMLENGMDHLAVYQDKAFVGVVSSMMLLDELQYSWDPMTGLPWSDRLREWGAFQLALNVEISIVFFDIDDFGKYNKVHGHTVGDEVIKALAERLDKGIDPKQDVLVRYAGDEFAIGTLRDRRYAEKLLQSFEPMKLNLASIPDPVWFSGGIAGGKRTEKPGRTQEREASHVSSTLDNLINLASKQCTANKNARKARRLGVAEAGLMLVSVKGNEVILSLDGRNEVGQSASSDKLKVVAEAAAKAFEKLTSDTEVQISEVVIHRDRSGEKSVSVIGQVRKAGKVSPLTGTQPTAGDLSIAIAQAVCNALA